MCSAHCGVSSVTGDGKPGEAAFAVAQMTDKDEERDHYFRMAFFFSSNAVLQVIMYRMGI